MAKATAIPTNTGPLVSEKRVTPGVVQSAGKRAVTAEQMRKMREGRKNAIPMAEKTGLTLAPQKFTRMLRSGKYAKKVSPNCGIWLAGAIEQIMVEVIECTIEKAKENNQRTLKPRHIRAALSGDEELNRLFPNPIIVHGGISASNPHGTVRSGNAGRAKVGRPKVKKNTAMDEEVRPTAANSEDEDEEEDDEAVDNEGQLHGPQEDVEDEDEPGEDEQDEDE